MNMVGHPGVVTPRRNPMTVQRTLVLRTLVLRILGAIAILTTTITMPVVARDARHGHLRIPHEPTHQFARYQMIPPVQRNTEDFRGRDPSRIGGEDPDLHPSAY